MHQELRVVPAVKCLHSFRCWRDALQTIDPNLLMLDAAAICTHGEWLLVICNHGDSDYSSSAIMATVTIRLLQSWRQWLFVICNHEQWLLVICNHGVTVHQRNYNWPILLLSVQCVTCDFISRFVIENAFLKINVLPETLFFFHTIERVSNTKPCCYRCVVNICRAPIEQELEHQGNNRAGTWTPG